MSVAAGGGECGGSIARPRSSPARPPRLCAGTGWMSTEARFGSVAPVSSVAIRCLPTIRSLPPVHPAPAIRHWELTTGNVTVRRVVLLRGGQEAPRTQGGTKRRGDLTAHRQAFCAEAGLLSKEPLPPPRLHGVQTAGAHGRRRRRRLAWTRNRLAKSTATVCSEFAEGRGRRVSTVAAPARLAERYNLLQR